MSTTAVSEKHSGDDRIWSVLETVTDPEIPVLTIGDLGMIRDVRTADDGTVEVVITPTYSGCPAMNMIEEDILRALKDAGFAKAKVTTVLSPAWTTDWLTDDGRHKLTEYGIAPPAKTSASKRTLMGQDEKVVCPQCGSANTERVSEFGSTACKALYKCRDCLEPFDYFKCI